MVGILADYCKSVTSISCVSFCKGNSLIQSEQDEDVKGAEEDTVLVQ